MALRKEASAEAQARYLADVASASNYDSLLETARAAEADLRAAQAASESLAKQYPLAKILDTALTNVMRSAFAAVRAEIGPRGYDDRIFARKARATPKVHALNVEAQGLLSRREAHRLTGLPPRPEGIGLAPEPSWASSAH